ncbi:MAG: ATP-binding protein [Verrucomicrobia bacterium]|nr:ATP-binding protein [Verrucomicrobiota bacterium]
MRRFSVTSFRKKFVLTYLLLLSLFLLLLFPFVSQSVQKIVFSSMSDRADELIEKLLQTKNESELIQTLKDHRHFIFYRIGILDDKQRMLYDSHTKSLLRLNFFPLQFSSHQEVKEAVKNGLGYSEEYSHILGQKLIYLAKTFDFHGKQYVLRLAFPHEYIHKLRKNCEIGFVLFSSLMLILFSAMTALILHHLSQPITHIIQAIKPYQEGKLVFIPEIKVKTKAQDEFAQLASTLNSLSRRIKNQIESLKEFVANASHELKTPLTIIRGFAETLKENPDLQKETVAEIVDKIVKNCNRMTTTVHNLLTLADIENLPCSRVLPCNLTTLAAVCRNNLQSLYPEVKLVIDYVEEYDFEIAADSELLEVAIMNLIDNAAKYSLKQPTIWLHFERVPGFIKVVIKDNGIGIPEKDLGLIFQRFYTVNKIESKKKGGSGLGLSIVKTIVEKHFGTISVESVVGEGSTFTMLIADDIDTRIKATT